VFAYDGRIHNLKDLKDIGHAGFLAAFDPKWNAASKGRENSNLFSFLTVSTHTIFFWTFLTLSLRCVSMHDPSLDLSLRRSKKISKNEANGNIFSAFSTRMRPRRTDTPKIKILSQGLSPTRE